MIHPDCPIKFSRPSNVPRMCGKAARPMRIAANNRNNDRYISVPVERQFASAIANFDIADGAKLFGELTYGRVRSNSQIEAFALEWTNVYTDAADRGMAITNPFIPADVSAAIEACNSETDPRQRRCGDPVSAASE